MERTELLQGSPEWHAHRASHDNASDAPAMMGESPYQTRNDFIKARATGTTKDVDPATQRRFDDGHRFEALARPLAEGIIGEELFPVTGTLGRLSASFDGLVMDDSIAFEHKSLNDTIRACTSAADLPAYLRIQMEQQLLISDAKKCLFMASKWEKSPGYEVVDGCIYGYVSDEFGDQLRYMLIEEKHFWYKPELALRERIVAGWKQFNEDVANYQHAEYIPAAVAAPTKDLPAIVLTVSGSLAIQTNFAEWGVELRDFVARIPEKPTTDQEFADCKAAVAALKKAEAQLDAEESRVLSMVPDIDEMKREKKLLRDLSSTTRLALEKLVVRRDQEVKLEIMQAGKDALTAHIASLNKRLATVQMPPITTDFAEAIKSKRNLENMRGAVSDLVAAKKIESNAIADKIDANLKTLDAAGEYGFLFNDRAAIVMKAPDDLALLITSRIDAHKAAEEKRLEEGREKIRDEEAAKLKAEADAKAAAEAKIIADQKIAEAAPPATPVVAPSISAAPPSIAPSVKTITQPNPQRIQQDQTLRDDIDEALYLMTDGELKLVMHYCQRIESERRAAA
jgi:putative phage-type endonuclease